MADAVTTYRAIKADLTDAIEAAWSPVKIRWEPFQVPENYSGNLPLVWIDFEITASENETAVTDIKTLQFFITGIFDNNVTDGNLDEMWVQLSAAQAELYAITNLGGYGYNGLMANETLVPLDGNKRFGVQFTYTCEVSIER